MNTTLRTITRHDYDAVCVVEAKSTPNLRYVPDVFDMFTSDARGEFFLAELGGTVVACAKFTAQPDGTGWLETLRVIPEVQGRGIGKKLYERYFDIARREGIHTLRMYTGVTNAVSKGLAEHFGFTLEQTFLGYSRSLSASAIQQTARGFVAVADAARAAELLMPHAAMWHDFVVMNRTFYKLTPALCAHLVTQKQVYVDGSENVVVLGARFSPQQALHIGMFAGDANACLQFAAQHAAATGVPMLHCLFPIDAHDIERALTAHQFKINPSPYIVMRFA
jgi:ribosomal protein S18 acetylase RimI-like enzyme